MAGDDELFQASLRALGSACTSKGAQHRPCTACLDAQAILASFFDSGGDCHDVLPHLRRRALKGPGPEGKTAADCILAGDSCKETLFPSGSKA